MGHPDDIICKLKDIFGRNSRNRDVVDFKNAKLNFLSLASKNKCYFDVVKTNRGGFVSIRMPWYNNEKCVINRETANIDMVQEKSKIGSKDELSQDYDQEIEITDNEVRSGMTTISLKSRKLSMSTKRKAYDGNNNIVKLASKSPSNKDAQSI